MCRARIRLRANYVWDESAKRFVKAAKPGTGTHELNLIAKLNAGNPAAVALYSDWIMKGLRETKAGPEGYAVTTVSVDPSDGPGEGNNYEELKAQGVGDGSEGDQAWFIANACARKVRAEFPEVSVVIGTYCTRAAIRLRFLWSPTSSCTTAGGEGDGKRPG